MIFSPIALDTFACMTYMTYMSHSFRIGFILWIDSVMHDACLPLVPSIKSNRTPLRLLQRAVSSSHRAPSPFFLLNNGCLVWVSWFLHVCFHSLFRVYHVMIFDMAWKYVRFFWNPKFFGAAFILIPQFGATQLQSLPFICLRSDPPPQKKSNKITATPQDTQDIYPKMMSKIHVVFWRGRSSEKKSTARHPNVDVVIAVMKLIFYCLTYGILCKGFWAKMRLGNCLTYQKCWYTLGKWRVLLYEYDISLHVQIYCFIYHIYPASPTAISCRLVYEFHHFYGRGLSSSKRNQHV